jgi:hypothetical protein
MLGIVCNGARRSEGAKEKRGSQPQIETLYHPWAEVYKPHLFWTTTAIVAEL